MKEKIKIITRKILLESKEIDLKIGQEYYYKNKWMIDSIKVINIKRDEWDDGWKFKKNDGSTFLVKDYELKYISEKPYVIDGYAFQRGINSFIADEIDYSPRNTPTLAKLFNSRKNSGKYTLTFTEEIKDGRDSSFSRSFPISLKGKKFVFRGTELNIVNITYRNNNHQESDSYSKYVNYHYDIEVKLKYT